MKHLTHLLNSQPSDVEEIFTIAADLKSESKTGARPELLKNCVLTQVFEKPSLRTRASFDAAVMQLGGSSLFLSSKEAGLTGRESLPDVARVLSSYSDFVVLRTFSQSMIEEFARFSHCPVVNGLSDDYHPCQALTDVFTMKEELGDLDGRRLVFVGDGNNVAVSLAILTSMLQIPFTLAAPADYQLSSDFLADLKQRIPTSDVTQLDNPQQAVSDAAVVYTDVWASMGQEAEKAKREQAFAPFQVNADLMSHAADDARFMHCLPARRGMEVTDEVIESPRSIVFEQAENRMHLAKGLLVWLLRESD